MRDLFGWAGGEKLNYLSACELIATDDTAFSNFKKNPAYTPILEHVSVELGYMYLALLNDETKKLIPEAHSINDTKGNPLVMSTPFGVVSPTTVRYLKVLQDLNSIFKLTEISSVVEIGAGYGGQARLLMSFFNNIKSYTCFDLKEPAQLQNRYNEDLEGFKSFPFSEDLGSIQADLVISNYAFSELTKKVQDTYIEYVLNNCPRGYIMYNPGASWEYPISEVVVRLTKSVDLMLDHPMNNFYPDNRIIYWS